MAYRFNPITGKLDLDSGITQAEADLRYILLTDKFFRGVLASAPSSPEQGWMYVNSIDNKLYIYYGTTWQALHTLTAAALEFLLNEDATTILLESTDKLALET